ncbi:MAG: hypothetical protein QOH24_2036 [Verrucomicrobiota bacterium]|jgi:tetratricopeptide (TPR) repeat protein
MTRADDYMLTAEELRLKRKHRRFIIAFAILLPLVLIIGIIAARQTRDAIESWQARRHAKKAFAFIAQENWAEARDEAIAAYQLRSTEPEAVRAIARLLTRTRQPQALEYWDQLAKITPLSRDDLRDDAAIALMVGDLHQAETAVKKLSATTPMPADFLLDAQLATQLGNIDIASADCEKVISDRRASNREQLEATMLELALDSSAEDSAGIWQRIEKIAQGKDAASLDALILLAQRALSIPPKGGTSSVSSLETKTDNTHSTSSRQAPGLPPSNAHGGTGSAPSDSSFQQLSAALEAHPLAHAPHKLIALDLLERADATQRDALIQRAVSQFKDGDANDVAALSRWLNAKGEHQRIVDIIPVEHALNSREGFLQYLDALGGLGRWADIKQLLGSERFPLDPFLQSMYLARCSAQLGEKKAEEINWQRATESAGNDPPKLMQVGEFAEKNAKLDVADTAYSRAIAEAPKLRQAYQARLRVARGQRDTGKLHEILAQVLTFWPNDIAVQNDEAYMRLLLLPTRAGGTSSISFLQKKSDDAHSTSSGQAPGVPPRNEAIDIAAAEEIEKLAQKLVEREPKSLPHRTLLALARLRGGHRTNALEAYNIEVPEEVITPSAVAVRAAVLYANGRIDEATDLIKQISPDQLVAEERALIAQVEGRAPSRP